MVIVMSALRIGVIRMKNKERYAKEIVELACDGNRIAVDRQTGELRSCYETPCIECLFHSNTEQCKEKAREWAESEYVERPVISKRDRAFLEYLNGKIKYITRDGAGELYAYSAKPCKERGAWMPQTGEFFNLDFYFSADFPMVKWEDSEPWLIKDMKKLEVVDSYE
mgnify:CR=1 FL=1